MSKVVEIKNTAISGDMLTLNIFRDTISGSNLLTSSMSSSGVFTGADLYKGLYFTVPDTSTQFYIQNLTTCVNLGSGSLGEFAQNVFYYRVNAEAYGSVDIVGSSTVTTATEVNYRQDFASTPYMTLRSIPTYPYEFAGWYGNDAFSGSRISNTNPVTVTSGSFSGNLNWYVRYQLGDYYY